MIPKLLTGKWETVPPTEMSDYGGTASLYNWVEEMESFGFLFVKFEDI